MRSAGHWATVWCLAAALLVPFTTSELSGRPLAGPPSSVTVSSPTGAFGQWTALEKPLGWLLTAGLALAVAIACRLVTRGRWALLVLAASGLVDAAVLAPPGRLFDTAYGRLLVVKLVLVAAPGLAGVLLRRRVRSLPRLAVAELVVLAGTVGVSVGLAHLPPPAFLGPQPGPRRTLLGYDLAGPPTLARLAVDWRIDVVLGPLAVLLAVAYLVAVRRRPGRWPAGRTRPGWAVVPCCWWPPARGSAGTPRPCSACTSRHTC